MPMAFCSLGDAVKASALCDKSSRTLPEADELEGFGVQIATVPHAGHAMMYDNLEGFVRVLKQAL